MVQLRGITWNHVRGLSPMRGTAAEYHRINPDVQITWDVRSLKDFGDYPIEMLCEKYDLLMLDHPFIGSGAAQGVLVPLSDHIPAEYLADQARNSVGPSYQTYSWNEQQWALAVDAAAQVAAFRQDLLRQAGVDVPRSWEEVIRLAEALPDGVKVAMPLLPTDAVCSFVSLCANLGGPGVWDDARGIDSRIAVEALSLLGHLARVVHPKSLSFNPPLMLDYMAHHDDVAYVPMLFGYTNYSRPGFAPRLVHFADIPSHGPDPSGSILGGVGLGISAFSTHREESLRYAMYVAGGECQRSTFFEHGGQPGHRSAWLDPELNRQASQFFQNTYRTMELSYVRPRVPGYNPFQERAGQMIHEVLCRGENPAVLVDALNQLYVESTGHPIG